jgi:hypothetical protein
MSEANDDYEFMVRQKAIDSALAKVADTPRLRLTGFCYNCDEKAPTGSLYCDRDCADDHEKRLTHKRRGHTK